MSQNAQTFVLNVGQFTTIENDHDAVSTTLWQHVAASAMFDSAERFPPGRCHPGTHARMLNTITSWIKDREPSQRVYWLYGPAGSGKSALMQTICELLMDSCPEMYAGGFFFARGATDRGNAIKLFATLCYQLALRFPSVRAEINDALNRDPYLPTRSIDIQLRSLIINPLLRCEDFPSHVAPVVIIDGLDECADGQAMNTQRQIITLISKAIVEHNIPLRFIIASRPEYWIRHTFNTSPLPNITFSLSLRNVSDDDEGIRAYLTDGFEKIRIENRRIMQSVALPWPPQSIIDQFVEDASGQYIYASTILKFVGKSSQFANPQEQLSIITSPGPRLGSAFSALDRLYTTILSMYPRWETMKSVLGVLLAGTNLAVIEEIHGVERIEITLILDALSSLIDIHRPEALSVDETNERISFCHLSFREFLEDKVRSGPFHVDVNALRAIVWSPRNIRHFVEQATDREGGHLADVSPTSMATNYASRVDELHGNNHNPFETQANEGPRMASRLGRTFLEENTNTPTTAFEQSQHMFDQAHDFHIDGGEFYNVAGSLNIGGPSDASQDASSHSTTIVHVSQYQHGFNHVLVSESTVEPPDNQTCSDDAIPDATSAQIEQETSQATQSKREPDDINSSPPVEVANISSHLSALECCFEVDDLELENDVEYPTTEISTATSSPIVVSDGELLIDDLIHDMLLRYAQPPIGNPDTFQRILAALLFSFYPLYPAMVAALLGLDNAQQVKQILLPASPFIIVCDTNDSRTPVRLINSSFSDFFRDRLRSQQYYLDGRAAHRMLLDACTRVIETVYEEDWRLRSIGWEDAYKYACLNWERHLRAVRDGGTRMRSKL